MGKALVIFGGIIVLYTIGAKLIGFPQITDYFPIEWFSNIPKGAPFKVVPSSEPSRMWLFTLSVGAAILALGFALMHFKKSGSL